MDETKAKAKVRWDVGANVHYLNDTWNIRYLFGILNIHLYSLIVKPLERGAFFFTFFLFFYGQTIDGYKHVETDVPLLL